MPKMDSPCMFCGGLPCVCDGGTKKKSSPSKHKGSSVPKRASPGPSSAPSSSGTEEDTEDVFGDIPATAGPKFSGPSVSENRDLSYYSALRVLVSGDILDPHLAKHLAKELNQPLPQAMDRRVAEWRKRHDQAQREPHPATETPTT